MNVSTIKLLGGQKRHGVKWGSGDNQKPRSATYCGLWTWGRDIPGIVTCQNCLRTLDFIRLVAMNRSEASQ